MDKPVLLCVDDEQRILNSLKMLFKKDYRVLTTTDGNQAIELLKKERVHVIISDQRMPRISGVEVLRKACEVSPNTMRILLTGYSDLAAVIGSINEGEIYRFVNKPWSNGQINQLVGRAAAIAEDLWQGQGYTGKKTAAPKSAAATDLPATGVLILDQEKNTLDSLRKTVTCIDQSLHGATSVAGALDILERQAIGVVIADINCGRDNIIEFINILKAEHPHIMVIVLTELMDFSSIVSLINKGQIFRYLPKPVNIGNLETQLANAIKRHHRYADKPALLKRHDVEAMDLEPGSSDSRTTSAAEKGKLSMGQRLVRRLRGLRLRLSG